MLRTLYGRMAAALLGLFCLLVLVQIAVQLWGTRHYVEEANQRLHRNLAANLVAGELLGPGGEVRQDAVKQIFDTLMVVNPSIEVYLLAGDGRVQGFSAPPGRVRLERVGLEPIRRFVAHGAELPIYGADPRHPGRPTVFSAAPLDRADPDKGFLYIVLAGERHQSAFETLRSSYMTRATVGMLVAAALTVALAALVLFGLLTRRLRRLARDVTRFGDHSLALAAPVAGSADEVDRLEQTFRRMAGNIQDQLQALRAADEERRRLVSNISHDLQTPLTSMQGHLETLLLKEGDLTAAERREFLGVAVGNARRLAGLVAELFALARLDAPETRLEREAFPLAELIQDVAQKFQVQARERKVEIQVFVPRGLPLIEGDLSLLERAVENLLKNALQHSPEGGAVSLCLTAAEGGQELRVRDRGPGIAPEDLPHLFERFYRGRGRRPGTEGAGLGLAIVHRIAELHSGAVFAGNEDGGGATFCLFLPAPPSA